MYRFAVLFCTKNETEIGLHKYTQPKRRRLFIFARPENLYRSATVDLLMVQGSPAARIEVSKVTFVPAFPA